MTEPGDRTLDLVVFGATGYTGRLVVEYLATHPRLKGRRWAIAGRSTAKLREVSTAAGLEDVEMLTIDNRDVEALDDVTKNTRVVLSTAGPFTTIGTHLVEACVRNCTHYCDVSSEVPWVRRMIAAYHTKAEIDGTFLIPMAGFDFLIPDIGAYLVRERARKLGQQIVSVSAYIKRYQGGLSGGSMASVKTVLCEDLKEAGKAATDPYYLTLTNRKWLAPTKPDRVFGVSYSKQAGGWVGPWRGSASQVVKRSQSLQNCSYDYKEMVVSDTFFSAVLKALLFYATLIVMVVAPLRWLAFRLIFKKPGTGPRRSKLARGGVNIDFVGTTSSGALHACAIELKSDPGYMASAHMVSEVALLLVEGPPREPYNGGFLTPAVFGSELVARLSENPQFCFSNVS